MIRKNKAQGLPINIVVMMIIGIIIFGLGLSMFSKFSSSGEEQISDLTNLIKKDIANLECNSNEWICSPSYKMKNGKTKTFEIFIVNNGDSSKDFSVELKTDNPPIVSGKKSLTKDCGSIIVGIYPGEINIQSGASASIPFQVIASRVNKTPCSFVTTATLTPTSSGWVSKKTSVIIRVE